MKNPRATPHSEVVDAVGTPLAWFDDALLYAAGRAEGRSIIHIQLGQ